MSRVENPYRPGFNEPPGELAGREDVLEDLGEAIEVAALDRRTPRPTLLAGTRGVGKTVMLGQAGAIAGERFGWPRVHVETRPNTAFAPDLIDAATRARELIEQPAAKRSLRAESLTLRAGLAGVGGEVRFARASDGRPDLDPAPALRSALVSLVAIAVERDSGFVLTLDEAHLATRSELAALAALLQEGTGERWPMVVVIAGLAQMRSPERSVTYLERGNWHELGLLGRDDAMRALQRPAAAAGRPMDEDAAALLAHASGGYPYAIQLYGHHAWRASAEHERIDRAAAEAALPRAARELARGLYAARWTAASPAQRDYLAAVAELGKDGKAVTGRSVAEQLGRAPKQLSSVRDDLIKAGTLTAEAQELRFTIPGMGDYVLGQERHR